MTQVILIHGGESTATKLAAALPGARVAVVYRQGLSAVYDENTGIAKEYPTLRGLLQVFAPEWKPGEPLVVLGYSAGAWALRYYLRDPAARSDVTAAIFLDGLYGAPGGVCNMAPYQGVLAYAKEANANPAAKRLVMTYSKSYPGPDVCSEAIKAAAPGDGVFTVPANNADHGAQQGVVGPAVVKDLIAPWIGGSSSSTAAAKKGSWGWFVGGVLLVGAAWYFGRAKRLLENPDRSADSTVVEYAVREMFKGKSPAAAAKYTAKKHSGFENMFFGPGVTEIDAAVLEEQLWLRMEEFARKSAARVPLANQAFAVEWSVDGTLQHFGQWKTGKPAPAKLKAELTRRMGSP